MRVIESNVSLEQDIDEIVVMKHLEKAGRVCYKSEGKISDQSTEIFISDIIKRGHESVIEHFSVTFRIICDRGVTHEIVRHRIASYSQESTRYCNYAGDKFGQELTFIKPCFWERDSTLYQNWENAMRMAESSYMQLINQGATPQEARSVLPNSLKSELVMTMNLREWRYFLKLRTSINAHPQMREVALKILNIFHEKLPVVFNDISA